MNYTSMKNLVAVYDAVNTLWDLYHLLGKGSMLQSQLISQILKVTDAINRESTLYEKGADWEESAVRAVLDDQNLTVAERAARLVGKNI